MVRVRFAPSPTGFLHIGGARTAVFNWMYAQAKKGKFILRIEDTDKARSQKEFVDEILQSLAWLGFHWDELYYQSERFDLYRRYAQQLLKEGKAYEQEGLSEDGRASGTAVIYKVGPRTVEINDLIRGKIVFDTEVIKDQVLLKSDGTPTYNFACVVDDATMNITHVIRGDDHISNTPKQVMLYEALGFGAPAFAHLPLIMGKEGGRLSKRTGATAISDYRNMGYLSETLVNYLLLLSWSPGGDREIVTISDAISLFDIKDVSKTAATFDMDKLNWLNNQYLKNEPPEKLADMLVPLLQAKGSDPAYIGNRQYVIEIIQLYQARMTTLHDFVDRADFFFTDEIMLDPAAREKYLARDYSREFKLFCDRLGGLAQFDVAAIEATFRDIVKELGISSKELIHPIRVALTGKTVGPGLFEVIYHLGKERAKARLLPWVKT